MTTKITMSDAATDKKTAMKDKKQEGVLLKHPPVHENLILFSNRFTLLIINYLEKSVCLNGPLSHTKHHIYNDISDIHLLPFHFIKPLFF